MNNNEPKLKILRLADFYSMCNEFADNIDKYFQELLKLADMNYSEWYESFYRDHLDAYPSADKLSKIWDTASQGKDLQILDVIVCVDRDSLAVLGMCALEYNELEPHCHPDKINPDKIYLTNLLVIPNARSQGIARKLIQFCQEWISKKRPEISKLYLNCQQKIMPYYLSRGWQLSDVNTGLDDWHEMFHPV